MYSFVRVPKIVKNSTASPTAAYMPIHLLAMPSPINRPERNSEGSVFQNFS